MSIEADLAALARFGGDAADVTRPAWSTELAAASGWLRDRLAELGLTAEIDPAGNVLGRWDAGAGKAFVLGSRELGARVLGRALELLVT